MQIYILHSSLLSFLFLFLFSQVLGESLHLTSEYLAQKAKVESAQSHVMTLEADNSKLKKDLIAAMNEANLAKEKVKTLTDELRTEWQLTLEKDEKLVAAKEKIKGIAAKAIKGFQQTEEYNTILFSWYFKGFELLRRYFIKYSFGLDLEKLDLGEVDKEMAADEAAQSLATETDTPVNSLASDDVAVDT